MVEVFEVIKQYIWKRVRIHTLSVCKVMIYDNKQPLLNTNVFYYNWLVLILCKRKRKQPYMKVIMSKIIL